MSGGYRLAKVRLVNWHNFVDEELAVEGSLFLIGDNGSGKTTLLDAIHVALTGNQEVELNAAARVGGRRDEGRDLTGILFRHGLTGPGRPGPVVGYVALELVRGEEGGEAALTIGVGAMAASPESRPELWGFVVPRPLAEVPLTVPLPGGGCRPNDRADLAAVLRPGELLDLGRYRSAVGERLFGGRERFDEVASFLRAGKAYRELVAKTGAFSELFASLLPAPDTAAFQEVRRAVEAIALTRTDLEELKTGLGKLGDLVAWVRGIDEIEEQLARYGFLGAHHERARAEGQERTARGREEEAGRLFARTVEGHGHARAKEERLAQEQQSLAASEGAQLLHRHEELAAREREAGLERQRRDLGAAERGRLATGAREALELAAVELGEAAGLARASVARAVALCVAEVAPDALDATARAADALDALGREPARAGLELPRERLHLDRLRSAIEERRTAWALALADAGRDEAREQAEAERLAAEATALRERGEVEPPLPGLPGALALLAGAGIEATPLYRLLEPAPGVGLAEAGLLERTLGRRWLGALVVEPEAHGRALALVLEHAPGIPLVAPPGAGGATDACAATADGANGAGSANGPNGAGGPTDVAATTDDGPRDAAEDTGSLAGRPLASLVVAGNSAAGALVLRQLGAIGWSSASAGARAEGALVAGERLDATGHLHAGGADERVPPGPPRWLGEAARGRALQEALDALEASRAGALSRAFDARERALAAAARRELLERAAAGLVGALDGVAVALNSREAAALARLRADEASTLASEEARAAGEREEVARAAREAVAGALREQGLQGLAARLAALAGELIAAREKTAVAHREVGRAEERRSGAARALGEASVALAAASEALADRRAVLLPLVPPEARADIEDYVLRAMRGRQIKPENLAARREEAIAERSKFVTLVKRAIVEPLLWQRHAFAYDEATNRLADARGRRLDEVAAEAQAELDELTCALAGKTDELLERIVLEDLAGNLRHDAGQLEETIRHVNREVADLTFGGARYRITQVVRPEFRRLLELLRTASGLGAGAREELREWFASRLDELGRATDGLPPALDYRRWFDFGVRISLLDEAGVELSRERLRKGSGGEQAVPNYLLLFCLTTLLYRRTGARLRLLLLDEAFYGVDAARREQLLRFCGKTGLSLVVATPELDGVTDAMQSSTTLLVEKHPNGDVHVQPFVFRQKQADLFEGATPDPAGLVIGRAAEGG